MAEWIVEITDGLPHLKNMKLLVRCKDCKFYEKGHGCEYLNVWMLNMDDWFCADGERKEKKR